MTRIQHVAVVLVTLTALPAIASSNLDKCREKMAEFDYPAVIGECTLAIGDQLSDEDRIEAYKLLAFANIADRKERVGREWFLRLLRLAPEFELGLEVSPRFRKNFEIAKKEFAKNAKLTIAHVAPLVPEGWSASAAPLDLSFEVSDSLGLVRSGRVLVEGDFEGRRDDPPTAAGDLKINSVDGKTLLTGPLPDPVREAQNVPPSYTLTYRVELYSGAGNELELEESLSPIKLTLTGPDAGPPLDLSWLLIAGGTALVVGGIALGAVLVCGGGVCNPSPQSPPVGGVNVGVNL